MRRSSFNEVTEALCIDPGTATRHVRVVFAFDQATSPEPTTGEGSDSRLIRGGVMGEFTVDIPALKGASAALVDVRTRLAAVECAPRLASLAGAMPGSAVAGQAVTAADDVLFFQRKTAGDLEAMAGAIAASATSYGQSDARSAQRQPTVTPTTAQRLDGGPR